MKKEVRTLNFYDFKYSKDDIFILSMDTKTKNKNDKGFLDVKIYSWDKKPVENANIRVYMTNKLNEYNLKVNASGHNPILINNVKFYPGYVVKLDIELPQSQDEVRDHTWSLGINFPSSSMHYVYAKKFSDEVNALSNGKIKINIYTNRELGIQRDMLKNLILNDSNIQFSIIPTNLQTDIAPKLSIFDMPMVYTNIEDFRKILKNEEFLNKISLDYLNSGYKLLGIVDEGFKQVASDKEIQNIEDFEGLRIRTIQDQNLESYLRSLGAMVVPLPYGEIYSSVQRGFLDASANPYEDFLVIQLYDVLKYIIETNHAPDVDTFITGKDFYDSLNDSEKAIIDEAAFRATTFIREMEDERINQTRKILTDKGMTILKLPEETIEAMRQKALPIYENIRETIKDDDFINLYLGN